MITTQSFSPVMPQKSASMAAAQSGKKKASQQQLKRACSELESIFIYYLLKEMRATIPKSDFLGGGYSEEIYTSMLDLQLSREIASKKGIGLSSALLNQLNREHIDKDSVKEKKDADCDKVSHLLYR